MSIAVAERRRRHRSTALDALRRPACSRRSARPPRSRGWPRRARRPSAGTLSPASKPTMSPGTSSSAGTSTIWPSRRTLAVMISICRSAATLSAALPSWCRPIDRVEHGQADARRGRSTTSCRAMMLHDRGAEQHELHEVAVLAQERLPGRFLRLLGELVRPVLRSRRAFTSAVAEPDRGVDREPLARLLDREGVPLDRSLVGRGGASRVDRHRRRHRKPLSRAHPTRGPRCHHVS